MPHLLSNAPDVVHPESGGRPGFVISGLAGACEVRYAFADYEEQQGAVSFAFEGEEAPLSGCYRELCALATGLTASTQVVTARGVLRADEIVRGDLVLTRSNGMQPVKWVGHRHLDWKILGLVPALRPKQIPAGRLVAGLPDKPVELMQHQRYATGGSDVVSLMESQTEIEFEPVSAPCCHLVQLLFEGVQFIHCDGLWLESFRPTHLNTGLLAEDDRIEIMMIQQSSRVVS
ncbi:Hint domain-containing protein [Thioclava kandeliae]|uniref:Hint domain-containing protein n=1 Tax=Thioclava kandeliae TaxID=3070818 RepID=A0ABV1SG88_9RHOB